MHFRLLYPTQNIKRNRKERRLKSLSIRQSLRPLAVAVVTEETYLRAFSNSAILAFKALIVSSESEVSQLKANRALQAFGTSTLGKLTEPRPKWRLANSDPSLVIDLMVKVRVFFDPCLVS